MEIMNKLAIKLEEPIILNHDIQQFIASHPKIRPGPDRLLYNLQTGKISGAILS